MKRTGLVALLLASLLAGCAGTGPFAAGTTPSPTVTPTPEPTAACPLVEDAPEDPGCAYYDPEHAMAQNEAYREELPAPAAGLAAVEALVDPVRAALEPVGPETSEDEVREVLEGIGVEASAIQIHNPDGGYPFAIGVGGACLRGHWTSAQVLELETGGIIADGGCLTAWGH